MYLLLQLFVRKKTFFININIGSRIACEEIAIDHSMFVSY